MITILLKPLASLRIFASCVKLTFASLVSRKDAKIRKERKTAEHGLLTTRFNDFCRDISAHHCALDSRRQSCIGPISRKNQI